MSEDDTMRSPLVAPADLDPGQREEPARGEGLQESQIQQIRQGAPPTGLSRPQEQALVAVDLMLRGRSLDDPAYRDTCQTLGSRGLAELVWLTGYYAMLALAVFSPAHPAAAPAGKHDEQRAT